MFEVGLSELTIILDAGSHSDIGVDTGFQKGRGRGVVRLTSRLDL